MNRTRHSSTPAVVTVALLLVASVAAYTGLLQVQQAMFTNGLPTDNPHAYPRRGADLADAAAALARYWPLVATVTGLYLAVLVVVRWGRSPVAGWIAVGTGVVGHLALLLTKPGLSIDLYSYIAHGYLANQPSTNPYLTPAGSAIDTPIGAALVALGWMPVHPQTPYGPLWTHVESIAVAAAASDVGLSALLLKGVVTVATIGTGLVAFTVAERVRAGLGALAASAWLLNPVAVVEFGVEGHIDAVPILFTTLALLAALKGWGVVAVTSLALATLTKYTPAVFGLAVLVMLARTVTSRWRLVTELLVGVMLSAALAWLLWQRWWTGMATLDGLRASTTPFPGPSPAGWLGSLWLDPYASAPSLLPQVVLSGAIVAVVLAASWGRTPSGWLAGCSVIAVTILAVSPIYWPWYSALPIAILALRPTGGSLFCVAILTAGSRFAAPWGDLAALGLVEFDEGVALATLAGLSGAVAACAGVALVALVLGVARRRTAVSAAA
ncbi:MAG TPA: hypothetical protein VGK18_16195 [Propionicimonas sp.]|uniref:hypothetical protein n=1 Tax=Propionicimonas sp. TaxID=1955623 RepID=UPI002F41FB03